MDEKKNTQNASSAKTPVSINAMSKMMAMQASLPELIFNLKLMGVNVGGSIINPFVAMTFVQAIETAVEKTGSEEVVNKFKILYTKKRLISTVNLFYFYILPIIFCWSFFVFI